MERQRGDPGHQPSLQIEAVACRSTGVSGRWTASWRIQNLDGQPLEVQSAWLPHDKFFSERREFEPPLLLAGLETIDLELDVTCNGLPGEAVENTFVILSLLWQDRPWRVFARHLITVDSAGTPQHRCQSVTVHPVGVS